VNRQADVFAVGVVLWEMIARRALFKGDPVVILNSIVNDEIPSPRTVRPDVAPALEAIAMKALERPLDRRYATAEQMRLDLERYLRDSGAAISDDDLAKLMNDLFATTREKTRARIQQYVERMGRDANGLASARDLPLVDTSSNPRIEHDAPAQTGASHELPTRPTRTRRILALSAALAVGLLLSMLAIRSNRAADRNDPVALNRPAVAAASAHLRLETTPPGALVEWNGKTVGVTPVEFDLEQGLQHLVVSRDGYEPEELTLELKPAESVARALVLRAKPDAPALSSASPAPSAAPGAPAPWRHAWPRAAASRSSAAATTAASPPPQPAASTPRVKIRMIEESSPQGSDPSDMPRQ
jgi:serine/threonine-protein kinase